MVNEINPISPRQGNLQLFPVKEVEIEGVAMGVLNDGTPYLTGRGLAEMCGVHHSVIQDISSDWASERLKPRGKKIDTVLLDQGIDVESLFIPSSETKRDHYPYPD